MTNVRTWLCGLLIGLCALVTADSPVVAQTARRRLTMAELEALPSSFPTLLIPPSNPALRPLHARMVELGDKFNTVGIGQLLSQVLYIESLRVPVVVEQCGAPDVHYARRQRRIRLCYEVIEETNRLLGKPRPRWLELDSATRSFLVFAMLHEMGHALVHGLGLPISGREEDAVDQLALLFMTQVPDREFAHRIVQAPAAFFYRHSVEVEGPAGHDSDDVHSSSAKRAGDALCLLYGRHPDEALAQRLGAAAPGCIDFARRVVAAWNARLAPYARVETRRMF